MFFETSECRSAATRVNTQSARKVNYIRRDSLSRNTGDDLMYSPSPTTRLSVTTPQGQSQLNQLCTPIQFSSRDLSSEENIRKCQVANTFYTFTF